jgi:RNA polymerase subunit RPABC4/transcription elongation factor Spt4
VNIFRLISAVFEPSGSAGGAKTLCYIPNSTELALRQCDSLDNSGDLRGLLVVTSSETSALAKAGVEGLSPFARSNFSHHW